jgi:putative transposase
MQSVKGIKLRFFVEEGNLELLLKRYSKAVNLFLEKIFLEKATSLSRLNKFRKEIYTKVKLTGYGSVLAARSALAIYRSWKRNRRKEIPKVKSKFIQLQPNYNCKIVGDKLRIIFEKGKYIWLELKVGKYQRAFLNLIEQGKLKLGQINVGKSFVVLSVKKDYLPYEYQGILALDINEKSIDGMILKNNELKPVKWELSKVYNLNQRYFGHKRKLQIKYPNRFNLWRKLPHNKNYRNRIKWYLDNVSKAITDFAKKEKLMIVMEDLKNIKRVINKRKLKLNKHNNKVQMMRTKPKSLLGRLNRTNFRRTQFMIDYKSRWNNIPIEYVNPKNTSRSCSICGEIGTLNSSTFVCERCGLVIDRHLNACINILKIGMAPCGSWSRLPKVEDLKNQISEVALMKNFNA